MLIDEMTGTVKEVRCSRKFSHSSRKDASRNSRSVAEPGLLRSFCFELSSRGESLLLTPMYGLLDGYRPRSIPCIPHPGDKKYIVRMPELLLGRRSKLRLMMLRICWCVVRSHPGHRVHSQSSSDSCLHWSCLRCRSHWKNKCSFDPYRSALVILVRHHPVRAFVQGTCRRSLKSCGKSCTPELQQRSSLGPHSRSLRPLNTPGCLLGQSIHIHSAYGRSGKEGRASDVSDRVL
jgi:hypothetical protein